MTSICAVKCHGEKNKAQLETMLRAANEYENHPSQTWSDADVGLAQARFHASAKHLSSQIIFGHLAVVADARLDNRNVLQKQLSLDPDSSNAQILIAAYEKWHHQMSQFLCGDFTFIIWDSKDQSIFASRDIMGCKKLCFHQDGEQLLISSDIRQILTQVAPKLSWDGLWMWQMFHYDDYYSLYQNIFYLKPGHNLIFQDGQLKLNPFWDPKNLKELRYKNQSDYLDHFLEVFDRSVSDRSICDSGIVGCMLSGGMDSPSIAATLHSQNLIQPEYLSFTFPNLPDCDESFYIKAAAKHFNRETNWIQAESFWPYQGIFDKEPQEDPFIAWQALNTHMMERLAAKGGTVLFSGHGGDSLMTGLGETTLLAEQLRSGHLGAWPLFRNKLAENNRNVAAGILGYLISPTMPRSIKQWLEPFWNKVEAPSWIPQQHHPTYKNVSRHIKRCPRVFPNLARQKLYEIIILNSWGIKRATHNLQRVATPFGIEVRHPFLDQRLMEFTLSIPQHLFTLHQRPKGFLREAMIGRLPDEVRLRKDKPDLLSFYHLGVKNEFKQIEALFEDSILERWGFTDKTALFQRINAYLAEDPTTAYADFYMSILLERWLQARQLARPEIKSFL